MLSRTIPHMTDKALVVVRHIILLLCFWLPASRRKKIERWLRGREEFRKLQRSDWVLMSWGKSGRTWLRVMLSRAYQLKAGLDPSDLLDFDNLKHKDPGLPAVFFTHNNYLRDYTGNQHSKSQRLNEAPEKIRQMGSLIDLLGDDGRRESNQDHYQGTADQPQQDTEQGQQRQDRRPGN